MSTLQTLGALADATYQTYTDIGSRYNVPGAENRQIWAPVVQPAVFNIHNKYILICTRPVFDNVPNYGTFQCYGYSTFWPY